MQEKPQYHFKPFVDPSPAQRTERAPGDTASFAASPLTPLSPPDDTSALLMEPFDLASGGKIAVPHMLRRRVTRFVAPVITLLLLGAIGYTWFAPAASPSSSSLTNISQQSFGNSSGSASSIGSSGSGSGSSGDIHVYVVGAVRHPGVYDLPAGARVYQLIQAAGGTLPNANLVALNMAAALTDGQEVYVLSNGEIPPTYQGGVPGAGASGGASTGTPAASGQLININTASADEMRSALHISSTTAQKIIDYRTQNGPYTSVDQLLNVVSKEIYDKIKNEVTV